MAFYETALEASKKHFEKKNFTDIDRALAAREALEIELRQTDKTCTVTFVHSDETGKIDLLIDRAMEALPEHKGQDERLYVTFLLKPGKTSKLVKSIEG